MGSERWGVSGGERAMGGGLRQMTRLVVQCAYLRNELSAVRAMGAVEGRCSMQPINEEFDWGKGISGFQVSHSIVLMSIVYESEQI